MDTIPAIKRFERGDRLYVQAQQIWLILVALVMSEQSGAPARPGRARTITYGDLAIRMGRADGRAGHTLSRQLGIIGRLCIQNKLPALNAIVVNQVTGEPGGDVVLNHNKKPAQERADVMKVDWFQLRVPTTGTFRQVWEASQ
jgi:hypothetical protein